MACGPVSQLQLSWKLSMVDRLSIPTLLISCIPSVSCLSQFRNQLTSCIQSAVFMAGSLVRMRHLDTVGLSAASFQHPLLTRLTARRIIPHRHILTFASVSFSSTSLFRPPLSFALNESTPVPMSEPSEPSITSHLSAFTFFTILWEFLGFIFRLPGIVRNFLQKEEEVLNEIEEQVDEAADMVKIGAKVIEKVAKEVEKIAETVEKDAEEVEDYMDNVKATAKTVHKEIDEVVGELETPIEGLAKIKVKVTEIKESASSSSSRTLKSKETIDVQASSSSSTSSALTSKLLLLSDWHLWGKWLSFQFLFNSRMIKALIAFSILPALNLHVGSQTLLPI